uniref:Serpin domain-containing protein n=1 Tax=Panagrolaimus superbus TaxID=310955 RepID=A0A914ZDJ6_9BILA
MLLAQTKFALDLLRENETQSSTIISPLSISIALDLALIGAKNDTADEIQRVIGEKVTIQEIHQYLSRFLLTDFAGVKFANNIFCMAEPLESYKTELQNHYNQILFKTIDFQDTQKAADIINNFVSSNTDNEIKDLVNADSLSGNVRMALINVLKFEKLWDYPFTVYSPYSADFYSKFNITTKV